MGREENIKKINNKREILYNSNQTPPMTILILSSIQHMILLLSMGMAVPVSIAHVAGLDLNETSSLLAASLFATGLSCIIQTLPFRQIGSGYMSFSAANSASLSACILAAQIGGIPLVLGMTVFSGILRLILGSFTFKLRRFFPAELTGTMIFILGISLVPTALNNFLGSSISVGHDSAHIYVALITLIFMISCTLFIKALKPYAALIGIVFGFMLSAVTGVFDVGSIDQIANRSIIAIPVFPKLSYSFDVRVLIPFIVITISTIIDNIGDFTAGQNMDNPNFKKPDWKSIEGGIRGNAIGTIMSGLIGGPAMTTSTANIGIAGACGITSRKVVYLAGALLMAVAFFPGLTGLLALIPMPVLGAILLYSGCYIMAGGFSILSECVIDDRRIFSVFLSIFFSISTLVPGLYSFLPEKVSMILVTPMVMGVCVLLLTTVPGRIGRKKTFSFECAVSPVNIITLNEEIENVCRRFGTERKLMRKLQISLDSLCESVYDAEPDAKMQYSIYYDSVELRVHTQTRDAVFLDDASYKEESFEDVFGISLMILGNIYDSVETKIVDGNLVVDMRVDL